MLLFLVLNVFFLSAGISGRHVKTYVVTAHAMRKRDKSRRPVSTYIRDVRPSVYLSHKP